MNQINNKLLLTLAIGLMVVLSATSAMTNLSEDYLDGAFKRALIGFAIARGLNGVISVAQGTEFDITPAGVGVSLAPGEILDPINDLVERFSWIMLLSSSAIGVQKVLLSMSAWQGLSLAVAIVGILLILMQWVKKLESGWSQNLMLRIFTLLLILRFMMPMVSLANEWVYRTFLQENYQNSSEQLEIAKNRISSINQEVMTEQDPTDGGIVNRAKDLYRSALKRLNFEKRLEDYKAAAESISENTISLIVVFLMQTIMFPLLFLWMVYILMKRVFV